MDNRNYNEYSAILIHEVMNAFDPVRLHCCK